MSALPIYRTTVIEEWIDYNGHLSEAFYVLVFGFATDAVMDRIGLGADARIATGTSLYTVEAHIRYLREVSLGAELTVATTIVNSGPKKLHLAHEMSVVGQPVATEEILGLHVGGEPVAAVPFPSDVADLIDTYTADGEPTPDWVGRSIQ